MHIRRRRRRQPHCSMVRLAPWWRCLVRHGAIRHGADLAALLAPASLLKVGYAIQCRGLGGRGSVKFEGDVLDANFAFDFHDRTIELDAY